MGELPKITIITPSFNQASYLEETIKSVVGQKYSNLEYIIKDGDSTDGSVEIIKKYAYRYKNIIKWTSNKDKGQVDAINWGISRSSGDIIAYINSDDYYLPGSFRKVVEYFKKNKKKDWVIGNCRVTQPNLKWTFTLKRYWPIQNDRRLLLIYNTINQPSVFLKNSMVKKVGKFNSNYNYAFDYDYWLRCTQFSLPGKLNEDLAVFRVHSQSKGSMTFENQFNEDYEVVRGYTNNLMILSLHKLGSLLTTTAYRALKS
jgi:glycosyltransferase involved in cell wall biosynthesis